MIVLDENIPEDQRLLLKSWRIRACQIGRDVGRAGIKDEQIIPLLLKLRRPTLLRATLAFLTADSATRGTRWSASLSSRARRPVLSVASYDIRGSTPRPNGWAGSCESAIGAFGCSSSVAMRKTRPGTRESAGRPSPNQLGPRDPVDWPEGTALESSLWKNDPCRFRRGSARRRPRVDRALARPVQLTRASQPYP